MKSQIHEYRKNKSLSTSKKMFKMTAVLLGWSSCVAQASKCPLQENSSSPSLQPVDSEQSETQNALARFQDLDKIYYL